MKDVILKEQIDIFSGESFQDFNGAFAVVGTNFQSTCLPCTITCEIVRFQLLLR